MQLSERMNQFQTCIFNVLDEKRKMLLEAGRPVYNLSVGTPDYKPDQHVMEALANAAKKPENYKYALDNLPQLIEAVQEWYLRRYQVSLDKNEIMSVYGSQEGLAHVAFPFCNVGDIVLAPNPGYPIFQLGPSLSGAKIEYYPLYEKNNYVLDFHDIPDEQADRAKMIIVSYPANPVCTLAPDQFYCDLIQWAKKHHVLVIHDNAYSELVYDGKTAKSFLSFEGAKDVGIEFNSLSKTYNMTGCRISFVVGNADMIHAFKTLRSQIDYGIFLPVQYAAIAALTGPQDSIALHRSTYEKRRNTLCGGLRDIGWNVPNSQGTMFAWGPIPDRYPSSEAFVLDLMDKTGLICVPGNSFGSLGDRYVRFALVLPEDKMEELVSAVDQSNLFK
ncbi:MAG: aminotransferase class I/II-fold pyridoxal phosphate-dependent enzyme [Clostridiales bacterium]|nr:aminotransferase class I/II-fold pyridoxal phosphate-dependent enzyme [Clostridiales bacterium]